MIAFRYLHRKNRAAEQKMLECRDIRAYNRLLNGCKNACDPLDIEALACSLLMAPSWERETRALRQVLGND